MSFGQNSMQKEHSLQRGSMTWTVPRGITWASRSRGLRQSLGGAAAWSSAADLTAASPSGGGRKPHRDGSGDRLWTWSPWAAWKVSRRYLSARCEGFNSGVTCRTYYTYLSRTGPMRGWDSLEAPVPGSSGGVSTARRHRPNGARAEGALGAVRTDRPAGKAVRHRASAATARHTGAARGPPGGASRSAPTECHSVSR